MPKTVLSIAQIKQELASGKESLQARAMQTLLAAVKQDAGLREEALPIFRAGVSAAENPLTAVAAASGIEFLAGAGESRSAWLSLIHHPREEIVVSAVLAVTDLSYAPVLLELLNTHASLRVQCISIHALGRMKYSPAFPAVVAALAKPSARPDAIEALEYLEDSRAIPHLEVLLTDETVLSKTDDRGAQLRVSDIAGFALRRLHVVADRARAAR